MDDNKFYVYEWYNVDTNEVFYVGKGCGQRYKQTRRRNQYFLDYIQQNNVDVRIVKNNLLEQEAFDYEKELTSYYKDKGQCSCCLAEGGVGGTSFVWTDEMKEYWSKYNPMKREDQRLRMKENNPMKNPEIAKKAGKQHQRPVVIDGQYYDGVITAAKALNVCTYTISTWCQNGGNSHGQLCRYADEEQKEYKKSHNKSFRPVLIDGIYYPTIKAGAEAIGMRHSNSLVEALKNGRKTCKGHTCEYANQQPS